MDNVSERIQQDQESLNELGREVHSMAIRMKADHVILSISERDVMELTIESVRKRLDFLHQTVRNATAGIINDGTPIRV